MLGVTKSQTWLSDFTFTIHFHALEKEMATHSSVLAWRIPGMGASGGLPSVGSHRVGHDWSDLAAAAFKLKSSGDLSHVFSTWSQCSLVNKTCNDIYLTHVTAWLWVTGLPVPWTDMVSYSSEKGECVLGKKSTIVGTIGEWVEKER